MTDELVKVALEKYRTSISNLKKGAAQESYRIDQLQRSFLGDLVVREVNSVHIASYRDMRLADINKKTNQPLSASTVRLEMSLASHFFDICRIEWGFADENPTLKVRKPKSPPGRERRLSQREKRLILRHAYQHPNRSLYSIIVVALESAMRQGEILGLRWEYINLKTRVAHLPMTKNGEKRDVPLSFKARDALIRMGVKDSGQVFNYTSNGLKSTWRYMIKQLGIENLHFHDLRHEAVSMLFELGNLDLMEVAAISGHKSLSMLKRYTHLSAAKLAKKLDGGRHRNKQIVLDNLIPYPALVFEADDRCTVRLLDFEDLLIEAGNRIEAIRQAQDVLLRKILISMRDSEISMPTPDQYLENVDQRHVIMIDPLPAVAC